MTLLLPFHALAEKWRDLAEQYDEAGLPQERDMANAHADELTELLGKVVVTDCSSCGGTGTVYFDCICLSCNGSGHIESALGVTK